MFGIMLITLIMYPGFKGAFADIIGYFFVSEKANIALSHILMSDVVAQTAINEITDVNVKSDLVKAAEAVTKMMGNKAIIINQITPLNFIDMWNTLKQMMKPTMFENEEIKGGLLDISVMRDNIGEAMWYIYTGILIISYTSFKITSATCPPNINNLIKRNAHKIVEPVVKASTKVVNSANDKIVKPVINNAEPIASSAVKPIGSAINNAGPITEPMVNTAQSIAKAKAKADEEARKAAIKAKKGNKK